MDHTLQRPEPGKWASAFFSVLMHSILALLLYYGVQWQRRPPAPISVELVRALPPMTLPPQEQAPAPKPLPPKPVEATRPAEEKPLIIKPDIALKTEEKKKPPKKPPEEKKPEDPKPIPKPEKKPEPKSDKKPVAEKPPTPPPRQADMDRLLARDDKMLQEARARTLMDKDLANVAAKHDAMTASASLGKAAAEWTSQIVQKVKSNVVRPQGVTGSPSVEFKIELLPSGDLLGEPKLVRSSGNSIVDEAARRAILKSSPLPKPTKAEVFQREINLIFHPLADGE